VLENQYGLSVKQIARRMKVSQTSVRRYLEVLLKYKVVIVNFTAMSNKSKRPINYYANKRTQ
jgi:response regulator of citrate/malate metabolism